MISCEIRRDENVDKKEEKEGDRCGQSILSNKKKKNEKREKKINSS